MEQDVSWQRTSTTRYFVDKNHCATVDGAVKRAVAQMRAAVDPEVEPESYNIGLQRPDLEAITRRSKILDIVGMLQPLPR